MPVKNRFAELLPEITAWRRDFHENPELLFDLPRTSARVAELLESFGCDEVVTGIARTGVVGVIRGRSDSKGRVIGLRADMDALPIHETTGLPFASKTPGKMHACGHDGHTAMLLGAAKYMAESRNFDGTVICIFQPAEEGGGGGREMVAEGLMERFGINEVYGMHNMPGLDVGKFAICEGSIMAAADQFEIIVSGRAGHAARPHTAIDATVIAAQIIVGLQTIVSRNVDPLDHAVVSVSTFSSDSGAHNILAQEVVMTGTSRTLSEATRKLVETRLPAICIGIGEALGAKITVNWNPGYPVTVNPVQETGYAVAVAEAISPGVDTKTAPLMAAEDFSYMLNERPGAYIFLGNGDSAALHNPEYNFDDDAIPFGASWLVGMAEARLPLVG